MPLTRTDCRLISTLPALMILIGVSLATLAFEGEDPFGIVMLHPTRAGGASWTSQAFLEKEFDTNWDDAHAFDPAIYLRGNARYRCTGNGELAVSQYGGASNPRIYIGDGASAWDGNLEVTFYSKVETVLAIPDAGWGGLESVVRTRHLPDSDDCNTRGYGARITLDGDCDIEREQSHRLGANSQSIKAYPWGTGGALPLNTWIGHKFVVRDTGTASCVRLELYIDTSSNGDPARQQWDKLIDMVDHDGKQWHSPDTRWCCDAHKDKSLRPPHATSQHFVYLRSDAVDPQYYKWISVREIDPQGAAVPLRPARSSSPLLSPLTVCMSAGRLQVRNRSATQVVISRLTISDAQGRTMILASDRTIGPGPATFDTGDHRLAPGVYAVQISAAALTYAQLIMISH